MEDTNKKGPTFDDEEVSAWGLRNTSCISPFGPSLKRCSKTLPAFLSNRGLLISHGRQQIKKARPLTTRKSRLGDYEIHPVFRPSGHR